MSMSMMTTTMFIIMFIMFIVTTNIVVNAQCPQEPMLDGAVDCSNSASSFGGKCTYPTMKDSTNCVWTCRCDGQIFHCSYREHAGSPMTACSIDGSSSNNNICSTIPVDTPDRQCNHL
ncbi:MAG: hypothetical protein ACI90V_008020 [Bacillariaceae sp.]|jgi:hypothetical protein